MSIATEIARLQQAKADIKSAIEAKGVTVPSSALLDAYDSYVAQISGGGGGGGLPAGATAKDWIECDGTQWIDTGVGNGKGIQSVDIFTQWKFLPGAAQWSWAFSGRINSSTFIGCQQRNASNDRMGVNYPTASSNFAGNQSVQATMVNGGTFSTLTYSYSMGTQTYNSNIFLFSNPEALSNATKARMWRTKIRVDGVYVRDFEPCTDPNGVGAFYDHISGQYFYGNNSSGNALIAGNN